MLNWRGERDESIELGTERGGVISSIRIPQADPISAFNQVLCPRP